MLERLCLYCERVMVKPISSAGMLEECILVRLSKWNWGDLDEAWVVAWVEHPQQEAGLVIFHRVTVANGTCHCDRVCGLSRAD